MNRRMKTRRMRKNKTEGGMRKDKRNKTQGGMRKDRRNKSKARRTHKNRKN